jgi:EAL domain-containing protein (putative c-di-GMP-specific phosphodiesterase class I)/CheY-like chemotaxis protein
MSIATLDLSVQDQVAALPAAFPPDGLAAFHQPVMDLLDDRMVGTEALVRWHRGSEVVGAPAVLGIAEESGLMGAVGAVMLEEACDALARLPQLRGDPAATVALNTTADQLGEPSFRGTVLSALERHGVRADRLVLEVTETALVEDLDGARLVLEALRAHGIRVALDDFGSGYCSMSYLQQLPIDILKIDRAFVSPLGWDSTTECHRAVVAAIVDLAHAFGLETIAEGVETEAQAEEVRALGCDRAQGFLWRPAVPLEELIAWHRTRTELDLRGPSLEGSTTVLVIDDDAVAREYVAATFACERSHQVVPAADGRQGIVLARHHRPDVIVLDLAMPSLGGLAMLPRLRAVAPAARIIVHTGLDDPSVEAQARTLGAAAVLLKGSASPSRLVAAAAPPPPEPGTPAATR